MFQSPYGVLGVCRIIREGRSPVKGFSVSVPLRGFRGLQESLNAVITEPLKGVSVPLRGFRGLQASRIGRAGRVGQGRFQSPCGVLGVCRMNVNDWETLIWRIRFQSPCGVLGVCRVHHPVRSRHVALVSVPLRGFRGLQGHTGLSVWQFTITRGFSPLAGF